MEQKLRIGISSCLLGNEVRYDGTHKLMHYIKDTLGQFVEFIPLCPEVASGMPVPRESIRLERKGDSTALMGNKTRTDYTEQMNKWISPELNRLKEMNLCGFLFKSKSPSCGLYRVKEYSEEGKTLDFDTRGVFAQAFTDRFPLLPVEEDGRMNDARLRENFIERIFALHRWHQLLEEPLSVHNLTQFYVGYKYTLMAHEPKAQKELGALIANHDNLEISELYTEFLKRFLASMETQATTRKNTNVLEHIFGYFKKDLTKEEKAEMVSLIQTYHDRMIPLIVPVTMLKHYTEKYNEEYLKTQYFLNPHPMELMLRNHV